MKVVCIKNSSFGGLNSATLTIGKVYDVLNQKTLSIGYKIKNDEGVIFYYNEERFINLSDHRERIIDEILSFNFIED